MVSEFCSLFFRSFNAKEECNMRKYGYLLPLEIIGITSNCSEAEVEHHLSEFNDILNFFEVCFKERCFFLS